MVHNSENIFGCGHRLARRFVIGIPVFVQVIQQFHHGVSQLQKFLQNRIGKIQNILYNISGISRFTVGTLGFLFFLYGGWKVKIEVIATVPDATTDDLSPIYTRGTAQPSIQINKDVN